MTTTVALDRTWDSDSCAISMAQECGASGGVADLAAARCDTLAERARALALGQPECNRKAEQSNLPSPHGRWRSPPPPPPPAPRPASGLFAAVRSVFSDGGASDEAEREPLIAAEPPRQQPSTWDALKARVSPAPVKPGPCHCLCRHLPSLSYQQRLMGFLGCFALGLLLSLTSLWSFGSLLTGNPTPFAFKYTLGNLLSMGASSFLVGPAKMCQDMCAPSRRPLRRPAPGPASDWRAPGRFAPVRRLASLLYVFSLCATLFCIFYLRSHLLTTVSIGVQLCSMVWYCFSYLPFGHTMLRRCVNSMC